jgi:hypothetical protein
MSVKKKNKGGRPVKYTKETFDEICKRIANGESLRKITRDDDFPEMITVYRWFRQYPELCTQYATAKQDRADTYTDEIIEIADDLKTSSSEEIQKAKLRVDVRKWIASKHHPRNYGDRVGQDDDKKVEPVIIQINEK